MLAYAPRCTAPIKPAPTTPTLIRPPWRSDLKNVLPTPSPLRRALAGVPGSSLSAGDTGKFYGCEPSVGFRVLGGPVYERGRDPTRPDALRLGQLHDGRHDRVGGPEG